MSSESYKTSKLITDISIEKADKLAIGAGAVKKAKFYAGDNNRSLIHTHYFNKNAVEVGYYSHGISIYHGFSEPRVWNRMFLESLKEWTDLEEKQ